MDRARYEKQTLIWALLIFGFIILRAIWMVSSG